MDKHKIERQLDQLVQKFDFNHNLTNEGRSLPKLVTSETQTDPMIFLKMFDKFEMKDCGKFYRLQSPFKEPLKKIRIKKGGNRFYTIMDKRAEVSKSSQERSALQIASIESISQSDFNSIQTLTEPVVLPKIKLKLKKGSGGWAAPPLLHDNGENSAPNSLGATERESQRVPVSSFSRESVLSQNFDRRKQEFRKNSTDVKPGHQPHAKPTKRKSILDDSYDNKRFKETRPDSGDQNLLRMIISDMTDARHKQNNTRRPPPTKAALKVYPTNNEFQSSGPDLEQSPPPESLSTMSFSEWKSSLCLFKCDFCQKRDITERRYLQEHVERVHNWNFTEYTHYCIDIYSKKVQHGCQICQNDVLHESEELTKHMTKRHKVTLEDYYKKYINSYAT